MTGSLCRYNELTPYGRDDAVLPDPPALAGFDADWPVLQMNLEDVATPLTRQDLLKTWPQDNIDLLHP